MGSVSLPRLGIALWFFNYSALALISYFSSEPGRLSIFWMIIQATVFMALELLLIGLWDDTGKAAGR